MPASNANPGFGVEFRIGDGASSETFTAIAEVLAVNGVGVTHRTSEVTHMGSTGGWAEHLALGVKEGKPFTLNVNFVFDDTNQAALLTACQNGTKGNYQIGFTDDAGSNVTFAAIINDLDWNHDRDSQAQGTISVLPSGAHTFGTDA